MPVLRTEPTGWVSWGANVFLGDEHVTELQISFFRSHGRFELDGESFTVEPRGFFKPGADLRKGNAIIARAEKSSVTRRRFEITAAGHRLELESRSFFGREYALLLGHQEVGTIQRTGFLGRRCFLEFPDEVPVFLQVFITYLVLVQAKREAAAASSGS